MAAAFHTTLLVALVVPPASTRHVYSVRHAASSQYITASQAAADCPSPSLSPIEVVEAQLVALQRNDVQTCFRFASPANKQATGPWQRFEMMVRQTPAYAPLVDCARFRIIGALPVSAEAYRVRVRVWPSSGALRPELDVPVLDYDWELSQQPPAPASDATTTIDDPKSTDESPRSSNPASYSCAGCWMVDGVLPDASPRDAWDEVQQGDE
jgi:hypothetical protein